MDKLNKYETETENDRCPVCNKHPEDLGYKTFISGNTVILLCEKCGVCYVPESIQKAMDEYSKKTKERSSLILPGFQGGIIS